MINFNNLKINYYSIKEALDDAIRKVIESGSYIMGEQLRSFEKEFAQYIGVNYCIGVASGTEAIALSLKALGIGFGDEVITTNVTAFPTITGILQANAHPVVVDINYQDGLMNCTAIEPKITSKTKAIVAVHLYGQCCEIDTLRSIARKFNLMLIEDAAQAAGATYKGKMAGSMGDCNAFSFYPTKNLGAWGDGGAITTNSEALYDKLIMERNYGQKKRNFHDLPGMNSRLDELQAAILRVKLTHLDAWNSRRNTIASFYRMHLKNATFLKEHGYGMPNHHLFVVCHEKRDACIEHLRNRGVEALIHYPLQVNKQRAFPSQKNEPFPQSETFATKIMSLPLYPELTDDNVMQIVKVFNNL